MAYVITIAKNTAPVRTRLVGSHKFGISGRTATGTPGAMGSGRLAGTTKQTKMGVPGALRSTGTPNVECGGALLSHTLSSAVPSPCQALASGFGKGPGVSPGP